MADLRRAVRSRARWSPLRDRPETRGGSSSRPWTATTRSGSASGEEGSPSDAVGGQSSRGSPVPRTRPPRLGTTPGYPLRPSSPVTSPPAPASGPYRASCPGRAEVAATTPGMPGARGCRALRVARDEPRGQVGRAAGPRGRERGTRRGSRPTTAPTPCRGATARADWSRGRGSGSNNRVCLRGSPGAAPGCNAALHPAGGPPAAGRPGGAVMRHYTRRGTRAGRRRDKTATRTRPGLPRPRPRQRSGWPLATTGARGPHPGGRVRGTSAPAPRRAGPERVVALHWPRRRTAARLRTIPQRGPTRPGLHRATEVRHGPAPPLPVTTVVNSRPVHPGKRTGAEH